MISLWRGAELLEGAAKMIAVVQRALGGLERSALDGEILKLELLGSISALQCERPNRPAASLFAASRPDPS